MHGDRMSEHVHVHTVCAYKINKPTPPDPRTRRRSRAMKSNATRSVDARRRPRARPHTSTHAHDVRDVHDANRRGARRFRLQVRRDLARARASANATRREDRARWIVRVAIAARCDDVRRDAARAATRRRRAVTDERARSFRFFEPAGRRRRSAARRSSARRATPRCVSRYASVSWMRRVAVIRRLARPIATRATKTRD